jgi:hypothetical protein
MDGNRMISFQMTLKAGGFAPGAPPQKLMVHRPLPAGTRMLALLYAFEPLDGRRCGGAWGILIVTHTPSPNLRGCCV